MSQGAPIATTANTGLQALGTGGQLAIHAWDQVASYLRRTRGEAHAALFAEPNPDPDRGIVDWYDAQGGEATPIAQLPAPQAEAANAELARLVADIEADAARLARATFYGQSPGGAAAARLFDRRGAEPGRRWYYASAETYVLALVLRAAIGGPISDYLSEHVWQPMGAEADASWLVEATGTEIGYMGFNAVLRDYARLGLLLADGGRAGGRQLVPSAWLREMARAHFTGVRTGRWWGYGFQTWVFPDDDGSFALLGVRGQSIFVDPARRLVLVHTAVRPDARDPGGADTMALWRGLRASLGR